MDLSKCLKVVGSFSPEEIQELENRASQVAGGAEPQSYHYLVAAEQILAEARGQTPTPQGEVQAPKAEPAAAPAEPTATGYTPTEQADIDDIDVALRNYDNTADEKRALTFLQWVMDEANENESPKVREYANQQIQDRASPADLQKLNYDFDTLKPAKGLAGVLMDPEMGGVPLTDATKAQITDGRAAARWLMANAKEEWHRQVAARLMRFLTEDVKVSFVDVGDTVPTPVARRLSRDASAVAFLQNNQYHLYFHAGKSVGETTLLHELIHAATMRGLQRGSPDPTVAQELDSLRRAVASTFRAVEATEFLDMKDREQAGFYNRVLTDPDELLAWGFSSPTMRKWLSNMKEDGTFLKPGEREVEDQILTFEGERQAGSPPTEPTLWQKFVDIVRRVLGLPAVHQPKFEQMLRDYEGRVAGFVQSSRTPMLYDRLDRLLQRAMEANGATQVEGELAAAKPAVESVEVEGATNLPPPQAQSRVPTRLREMAGGWKNFPGALGWLTNRQLAERFKGLPAMQRLGDFIGQMSSMAKNRMQEAHVVDQEWAKLDRPVAVEMQRLMLESTLEKMHVDRPLSDPSNKHLNATDPAVVERHRAMAARFDALPMAAKKVFRDAEAKFRKDWNERGALLKSRIIDQYRTELAATLKDQLVQVATLPKTKRADYLANAKLSRNVTKALHSLWGDLDAHAADLARVQGPYFPLVRFGNHVVVAKSAKFLRAQQEYQDAVKLLDSLNDDELATPDDLTKAREDLAAKRAAVSGMKDNPRDYVVEFYETRTEAQDRETQLKQFYQSRGADGTEVYSELRTEHFARLDSVSPAFMNKLEETLRAGLPDKDAATIRSAVRDLYIQAMPERSALKAQLARMNVRGAKVEEVRRAFAASTMRNAWHLSRLAYNLPMHEALTELREGKGDESRLVGAEMAKRFVNAMTYDEGNQFAAVLANLGYFTYLGLSPSFLVMNLAQPWLVSAPIMAARFGMGGPTREMSAAFKEVAGALKSSAQEQGTWRFELDMDKFTDPNERAMLSNLFDKGIIDITIEHDLGGVAAGQLETSFGKVMQFAALPAHHTEVLNRVMTALAAYRLDKQDSARSSITGADAERRATAYAEKIVAETHLDYTPENAPRLMRSESLGGFGRLVFQFKKYSQGMLYLIAKNLIDASRGDKEALKATAYLMGMTLGVAGTAGLPIAAPVGVMFAAFSKMWDDDDEPEIGTMMYNGLKSAIGETAARAVVKGLPAAAGVDLSQRIGLGQLLDPFGLTRDSVKPTFSRDWTAEKLLSIAGPAPSMAANWLEAMTLAADGEVTRAATMALPKFLADPVRAMTQANEGLKSRSGDTIIPVEELGLPSVIVQAVGFRTTDVTDTYQNRAAMAELRQNRDTVRQRLIREFVRARQEGSDVSAVREEVQDFNSRHPGARITYANLEQAVARQRQQDRQMKNGVRVGKRDAELAEDLGL